MRGCFLTAIVIIFMPLDTEYRYILDLFRPVLI